MNIEQRQFLDFLGMPGVRFSIPSYQRIYAWDEAQCEELWLDLVRAGRFGRSHFIGTILYSKNTDSDGGCLSIIDGQQRMLSVSILLLALDRFARKNPGVIPETAGLGVRYLKTLGTDGEELPKITPSSHDIEAYLVVLGGSDPDIETAIGRNLAYFETRIDDGNSAVTELIKGISGLSMIAVQIEEPEMAQSVFEGINSKGVPLNVADMVRNYLLLAYSHDEQTRFYEEYWKPSQEMFEPDPGSLRLNGAIKSWISIRLKGARILSADQVYNSFKKYVEDQYCGSKEPVLRELRGFCLMWAENYRYHGTKKYKSGSDWAEIGMPTLTAGYKLKKADNEEYAERLRKEMREMDSRW